MRNASPPLLKAQPTTLRRAKKRVPVDESTSMSPFPKLNETRMVFPTTTIQETRFEPRNIPHCLSFPRTSGFNSTTLPTSISCLLLFSTYGFCSIPFGNLLFFFLLCSADDFMAIDSLHLWRQQPWSERRPPDCHYRGHFHQGCYRRLATYGFRQRIE